MEKLGYNITKEEYEKLYSWAENIYNSIVVVDYFCKVLFHLLEKNHDNVYFKTKEGKQRYIFGAFYSGLEEQPAQTEAEELEIERMNPTIYDSVETKIYPEEENKNNIISIEYTTEELRRIKQHYILELIKLQKKVPAIPISNQFIQSILDELVNNCSEDIVQKLKEYLEKIAQKLWNIGKEQNLI